MGERCGCKTARDVRTGRESVKLCPQHAEEHRAALEQKRREGWGQDKEPKR